MSDLPSAKESAMSHAEPGLKPVVVSAPVDRVTVLEDRAQVRRTARVELQPGAHLLRAPRISPLVVDRTLRGAVTGPARLRHVALRRHATVRAARPELERELAAEVERLYDEYLSHHDRQRAAEAEERTLERCRSELLGVACAEAGRGVASGEWERGVQRLEERLAAASEAARREREACDDLAERLEQLGERQLLALTPTSAYWGNLEAVLEVEGEGGRCEVSWEYLVPCALWRPAHQAELQASGQLRFALGGMVWQATGEDWSEVRLCLSTARPALGGKLPLLEEDQLRLRAKSEAELSSVQVESRDEEIAVLSPAGETAVALVPGVDDGGEVRRFELPRPVSVPADGRAHLFELDTFTASVELDRVCYPEVSQQVVLRSRQLNAGRGPILAGPVALIRGGGFAGRTLVGFVAPGERFELGWGSLDELQVSRRVDDEDEQLSFGRGARRHTRVRLYLSNLGREPQTVQVIERVPVSEVEEVRVKILEKDTTPGARSDEHGHLRWEVPLAAEAQRDLTLAYDLESTRKVVWG